jgi:hypothetical protein
MKTKITVYSNKVDDIPEYHSWLKSSYGFNLTQEQKREALQEYIRKFGVSRMSIVYE